MQWFNPVYNTVVGLVIGALVAWVKTTAKKSKEKDEAWKEEQKALKKGMAFLLRAELDKAHNGHIEDGYISSSDLEEVKEIYETYHALGGNGVGTKIYEEIKALPIRG